MFLRFFNRSCALCLLLFVLAGAAPISAQSQKPAKKAPEASSEVKRLRAENDSLRKLLRFVQNKTRQSTQSAALLPMLEAIDIRMDRLKSESRQFLSLTKTPEFTAEETRLKTLARDQEAEALFQVSQLRTHAYPLADSLATLIRNGVQAYSHFISYESMRGRFGSDSTIDARYKEFFDTFSANRVAIARIVAKERDQNASR